MTEIKDFISLTSTLTAAARALETQRPDRLFEDPFAFDLAGSQGFSLLESDKKVMQENATDYIAVRTRFFDDFLISSVLQSGQVVLLGAGMDSRAYRLRWKPNVRLYEVDQPEVLATKDFILREHSPTCHRQTIASDSTKSWTDLLITHKFNVEIPTLWLLEGILVYLSEVEVHNLGSCQLLVINTGTRFKAEGRRQRAAMWNKEEEEKDIIKLLTSNFRLQTYAESSQCWR